MKTPRNPTPEEIVTSEDLEAIAIKKKQEDEAREKAEADKRRRQAELEQKRQQEEAQKRAEAEAQRKADEEAQKKADYEKAKKQFGDAFGGSGKGKTDKPGNQEIREEILMPASSKESVRAQEWWVAD